MEPSPSLSVYSDHMFFPPSNVSGNETNLYLGFCYTPVSYIYSSRIPIYIIHVIPVVGFRTFSSRVMAKGC